MRSPIDNATKDFRQISLKEFDVPHIGRRRYKVSAFKSWLRSYKIGDIDALMPQVRSDKGISRKIDKKLGEAIKKRF